ncbi:MAG: hypothetical protein ACOVQX_04600 [Legionella sp.]
MPKASECCPSKETQNFHMSEWLEFSTLTLLQSYYIKQLDIY